MEIITLQPQLTDCDAVLSAEEIFLADKLVKMVLDYVENLMAVERMIARPIAKRLLKKLQLADLGEDAVGIIGEGIWRRLNEVSVVTDDKHPAESQIVKDIMQHNKGTMAVFINHLHKKMLDAAGPKASDRIIYEVALRAWPQVRVKLGV